MRLERLAVAALASLLSVASAQKAEAAFIFTDASFISVTTPSTITLTYLGFSAGDTDELRFTLGGTLIFINNVTPVGTTFTTAVLPGPTYQLTLNDISQGTSYSSDPGLNSGGERHLASTTNFADFGVGPTSPVAAPVYYGWEDRPITALSTLDYNDLIFSVAVTPVPEPISMALLGAGLLGLGLVRSKRS